MPGETDPPEDAHPLRLMGGVQQDAPMWLALTNVSNCATLAGVALAQVLHLIWADRTPL